MPGASEAHDAEKSPERVNEREQAASQAKHKRWAWISAGVVLALSALAFALVRVLRPPELLVVRPRVEDVSRMLAVTGRIEARQTVVISPQVSGRISEILHYEGERVRQGDVLARLLDVSARANVAAQSAAVAAQREQSDQADRELSRSRVLTETGATAPEDLERAQAAAEQSEQELVRLSASLREQKAQAVLTAPFDGMLVRRDGEVGQVVGPGDVVFELATVDQVYVSAEVDERYAGTLRQGMRAEVMPLSVGGSADRASVSYVARAVDPETGAATVRFAYDTLPRSVLVGASVDVNVHVDSVARALIVPREAIGGERERPFVMAVVSGRTERRAVQVEDWPAAWVVVKKGLARGDAIARDPESSRAGERVRAKEDDAL